MDLHPKMSISEAENLEKGPGRKSTSRGERDLSDDRPCDGRGGELKRGLKKTSHVAIKRGGEERFVEKLENLDLGPALRKFEKRESKLGKNRPPPAATKSTQKGEIPHKKERKERRPMGLVEIFNLPRGGGSS